MKLLNFFVHFFCKAKLRWNYSIDNFNICKKKVQILYPLTSFKSITLTLMVNICLLKMFCSVSICASNLSQNITTTHQWRLGSWTQTNTRLYQMSPFDVTHHFINLVKNSPGNVDKDTPKCPATLIEYSTNENLSLASYLNITTYWKVLNEHHQRSLLSVIRIFQFPSR